ncbi:M4 family metallopeptidase [Streptomyces synnematoformans]|uniref:M4 family metallopeptidase n=1 Tax=Streptomyces synnematoformans TaxID=415721 RepID=UPI0031CF8CAF
MRSTRLGAVVAALALTAGLTGAFTGTTSAAPPPSERQPSGKARALAAADRAADSGLDGLRHSPGEELVRTGVTPWDGGLYYAAYERTYLGLPVTGGDAVVLADSRGRVLDVAAAPAPELTLSPHARISAAAAEKTAAGRVARPEETTRPELGVLIKSGKGVLTWQSTVTGTTAAGAPSVREVYVDARTGEVVETREQVRDASGQGYHNGTVEIDTAASSMTDPDRAGFQCGGQNGAPYTSPPWGNGGANDLETACVDIMYAAQHEFDMLNEWLGYNGQNGRGGLVPARAGLSVVNAYYDGTKTTYGRNQTGTNQLTSIDVVAHEYGHEIFHRTPGGTGSGSENGGMNESTGDIFGAVTEAYINNPNDPPDYTVGEKARFFGDSRPIRNMYNPSLVNNDPNCYTQLGPGTEVHAAAGPQNHWFYLLAEGSDPGGGKPGSPICSGGPSSVTGIGIQKAAKVFMGGLLMKTSAWNHRAARAATVTAAKTTYGAAECNAVKAAWSAVAVPAAAGEADCGGSQTPDFSLALSPDSGRVESGGGSATATVGTTTTGGEPQDVALTASGAPGGATVSFAPATVTSGDSATMTVDVGAATADGTYPIRVTGTGSTTHSVTYTLTVGSDTGGTWAAWTSYQAGDTVTYGGRTYRCLQAHTALPGWEPPNVPALWQPV